MSPERRARVIGAIREIYATLYIEAFDDLVVRGTDTLEGQLKEKSDAQLSALLLNLEALLERAQGTDI
jgi:hypothetical protein